MAVAEEVVSQVLDKSVPVLESVWSVVICMAIISVVPMSIVVAIVRVRVVVNSVVGIMSMVRSIMDRSSMVGWQWGSSSRGSQDGNNE